MLPSASSSFSQTELIDFQLHGHPVKRVPVPIFVNEILRRRFAQSPNHCGQYGRHPDEIACRHGIPMVAEAVDSVAGEHQETVLHHVDLYHRQRRAGLKGHRVHGEIEGGIRREQRANLQSGIIAHEGLSGSTALSFPVKNAGGARPAKGYVWLLDYRGSSWAGCG